ncbi:MAG: hypothetical protein M1812_001336 [Candelaria pacifica]|nr:MAG: hypothetical protein M1812_001336 [Candelaria pacifica]
MSAPEKIVSRTANAQARDHEAMDEDAGVDSSSFERKRSRDRFDKDLEREALDIYLNLNSSKSGPGFLSARWLHLDRVLPQQKQHSIVT